MKLLNTFAAFAVVFGSVHISHANLLLNGNLDRSHAEEVVSGFFLPRPDSWQSLGFRSISGPYNDYLSLESWAGPAPTPVTTDGNLNGPYPDGYNGPDGGVFFRPFSGNTTDGAATSHLYQDAIAAPGMTYKLTGWAGAEANYLAARSLFSIDFLDADNNVIANNEIDLAALDLFTPNGQPFNYKEYTVVGTAPANATTVRARVSMIDGIANPMGGGQAFVVDDFELTAVPEPSTIALGILSAGSMIAMCLRRRRR